MENENTVWSYICAIFYTIVLGGICYLIYSNGDTSLIGLIFGIIFSIALGVTMALGGFYLIIIPLPFIYLFKYGCTKPYLDDSRKILLAVLSIVFIFMTFIMLYVLK